LILGETFSQMPYFTGTMVLLQGRPQAVPGTKSQKNLCHECRQNNIDQNVLIELAVQK